MTAACFTIDDVPSATRQILGSVRRIYFPQQGATSTVAVLECDPDTLVVKRAQGPQWCAWLEQEQRVLTALAETGLAIPQVIHFEQHMLNGPEAWLLMSYLPGVPIGDVLCATHDRAARDDLLQHWGAALAAVHHTPAPTALRDPEPWLDRMLMQATYHLQHYAVDGSEALLDQLNQERPETITPTLIHGDFTVDNTLIADGQVVGIIDWAGGSYGDRRYDLALALDDLSHEDREAFWRGYGKRCLSPDEQRYFIGLYEFF